MAAWELVDAHRFEYHDEAHFRAGVVLLVVSAAIALLFTLSVMGVGVEELRR